jgi:hypothetical protein
MIDRTLAANPTERDRSLRAKQPMTRTASDPCINADETTLRMSDVPNGFDVSNKMTAAVIWDFAVSICLAT